MIMEDKTEKIDLNALMEALDDMRDVEVTVAKDPPSIIVYGNTYPYRDKLKKLSFQYDIDTKQWVKYRGYLYVLLDKLGVTERIAKKNRDYNLNPYWRTLAYQAPTPLNLSTVFL